MTKDAITNKKEELKSLVGKSVYGISYGKVIKGILLEVKETRDRLYAVIDHTSDPVRWGNNKHTITENFMDKKDGFGSLKHFRKA